MGAEGTARDNASNAGTTGPKPSLRFVVQQYQIRGDASLTTNISLPSQKFTGTNLSVAELVSAASELRSEYQKKGQTNVTVAISPREITNGIVTLNVFRAKVPQILVAGTAYSGSSLETAAASISTASSAAATTRTNTGPRFAVRAYEIRGDTLLSTESLTSVLGKYTGTNVGISDIVKAASDLQMEYRDRGYPTVAVTIPQQQLTNEIVKFQVFEGRLSDIVVEKNRYFSSNNVMRALPSLHTNTVLNGQIFQAELDRANANQDRQIYPQIEPGPETNTTLLRLEVKDRLPLHAKIEFNNQSSPGTPELRLNSSAVYNNLWQYEHSLGVQYSFSPAEYKQGDQWNFYDLPLVANYSAFYRLPLGGPEPVENAVAASPGTFGYSEATRQFRLPTPSGAAEVNVYGSRSTIDTGLEILSRELIYNVPGVRQVLREDVQQDLTINETIGFRLSLPLPQFQGVRSTFSTGLDYKWYQLDSHKTNNFQFTEITVNEDGTTNPPVVSTISSPVPTTRKESQYLPLVLRWDGNRPDKLGTTFMGAGVTMAPLFSGTRASADSSGHFVTFTGNLSRDQTVYKEWKMSLHVDAQWATEPLIPNEQFGNGGVNGVRGYREGETFGDTGWRVTLEQKTPPQVIGTVYGRNPLVVRGSVFMDYGETYLLDPGAADGRVPLWGAGFGGVASIGPHFEARFLCSWPFLRTPTTEPGHPRFDFSLSAQF